MVRPSASPENKRISIAFAHMVTVPAPLSGPSRMSVCRTGPYSLYHALGVCCPSSVVNPDPYIGKQGLREIEFYKLVERSGFVKVRQQRSRAKDGSSSSSSAASSSSPSLMGEEVRYLYAGRRWRDPRDEEDLRRLTAAWEELAGKSAIFAGQCGLEKVLRVCEEYGEGWREYQGRQGGGEGEAGPRGGGAGKRKRREVEGEGRKSALGLSFVSSEEASDSTTDESSDFVLVESNHWLGGGELVEAGAFSSAEYDIWDEMIVEPPTSSDIQEKSGIIPIAVEVCSGEEVCNYFDKGWVSRADVDEQGLEFAWISSIEKTCESGLKGADIIRFIECNEPL